MPGSTRGRGRIDRPSRVDRPSRKNRPSRRASVGFVAIDGEAVNEEGEHRYVMLCASDGTHAFNAKGLTTSECFEFLLGVKDRNPRHRFVGFGFNYDVNMILRDLSTRELKKLWDKTRLITTLDNGESYRIEWIPGKTFSFSRLGAKRRVLVSDVFGFFQMSFVRSLEAWDIPDEGGHIARMKKQRSDFRIRDKDLILEYCLAECDLLVTLMMRLEDSLSTANLRPSAWIGAGSVAASMLRRFNVPEARVPDSDFGPEVKDAIMHAYFGGRTEVFLQGVLNNVVNYDINSAYPTELLDAPNLIGGSWHKVSQYDPGAGFAIWRVEWDISPSLLIMPFPFRHKGGIYYPQNGAGWYHAKEVQAARSLYGDSIRVNGGFIFQPANDLKPFDFIRDVYEQRKEAKRNGHASEKAFKLGINALYGKLAQGYGFAGRVPPFQSFYWAGQITAGTRSRLLDMARANPSGVVSMATDGIVFSGDPGFPSEDTLGGLEKTVYSEIFIAQPGIYRAVTDGGKEILRSRGFFTREIDYPDLQAGWIREGPYYRQYSESTRFVGAGSALMRSDMSEWRTWVTSDRVLTLYSSRKFYDERIKKGKAMRLYPPRMTAGTSSEVYVPKGRGLDIATDPAELIEGLEQPMEVF